MIEFKHFLFRFLCKGRVPLVRLYQQSAASKFSTGNGVTNDWQTFAEVLKPPEFLDGEQF